MKKLLFALFVFMVTDLLAVTHKEYIDATEGDSVYQNNKADTVKILNYKSATGQSDETIDLVWLSPNPAHDYVYINTNGRLDIIKVEIYNLLGRQMYSSATSHIINEIPLSGYEKGIYLVKVYTNYGSIITKKLSVK
jgi:hypothetical protein